MCVQLSPCTSGKDFHEFFPLCSFFSLNKWLLYKRKVRNTLSLKRIHTNAHIHTMWRNSHWSFSQGPVLRADWLEAFVWAHFKNKTGAGLPRIHTYTERLTHTNPHSLFVLELSLTRGGKGATASSWCCLSEVCVCAAILYSYAHYSTQPPPDSVITGLSMCTWAQTHTCGLKHDHTTCHFAAVLRNMISNKL